ncbi:MAG: hypothetical protein M1838_001162 [Thelocarpon superellum]|nr:MAG: hypothetical protein M1838_001162 [Thelocarpon superellum]
MKTAMMLGALALLHSASAVPTVKRQAITDADILQYALTLEHLENVFYKGGVSQFNEAEFISAGFSSDYYNNLKYIVHDEEAHVELITSALSAAGATPVAACTYKFPYTDPKGFVSLASVLEGVGTSAYLGAAPSVSSKDYLTVAGSILVTEALHTSLQRFALGEVGPANPYGTPLGFNEVYTLAAAFIESCPSSNAALPVKAFPGLTATQGIPAAPGITFTFTAASALPSSFFVTFVNGLTVTSVTPSASGDVISAVIPETTTGQTYVVLTSANVTALSDAVVLFGPAILEVTPSSPTFDTSEQ